MTSAKQFTVRWVALLGLGALLLHEIRYYAGYGGHAQQALAEQGHSYLPLIEALVALLLVIGLARFLRSLAGSMRGGPVEQAPLKFGRLWALSSAALTAVYCAQEGLEGELSPGHAAGLLGIFGNGGWTALVLALAFGALIAAFLHVVHVTARKLARQTRVPSRARVTGAPLPGGSFFVSLDVLARNLAARAPPHAS